MISIKEACTSDGDARTGEVRVTEVELTKHLVLTCPNCGHIYEHFLFWDSTRFEYWCAECGKPLYWEQ